jgi:hypothetical protein
MRWYLINKFELLEKKKLKLYLIVFSTILVFALLQYLINFQDFFSLNGYLPEYVISEKKNLNTFFASDVFAFIVILTGLIASIFILILKKISYLLLIIFCSLNFLMFRNSITQHAGDTALILLVLGSFAVFKEIEKNEKISFSTWLILKFQWTGIFLMNWILKIHYGWGVGLGMPMSLRHTEINRTTVQFLNLSMESILFLNYLVLFIFPIIITYPWLSGIYKKIAAIISFFYLLSLNLFFQLDWLTAPFLLFLFESKYKNLYEEFKKIKIFDLNYVLLIVIAASILNTMPAPQMISIRFSFFEVKQAWTMYAPPPENTGLILWKDQGLYELIENRKTFANLRFYKLFHNMVKEQNRIYIKNLAKKICNKFPDANFYKDPIVYMVKSTYEENAEWRTKILFQLEEKSAELFCKT